MNNNLKTIIGLEIHVQLNTRSKMFCGCDNNAENKEPNTVVCPVCMGYPGTLPVANVEAIKKTILTGLALNCEIPNESKFDRKHYFYPDLPKNFQISQYDQPFAKKGKVDIYCSSPDADGTRTKGYSSRTSSSNSKRAIRINRVHLEEDAGKLIHPKGTGYSLVDMNRCGTPLMEIVTEPDIDSPQMAKLFLKELRLIIRYLGVSDADMEKGHLRCDANISVREQGTTPIVEIKNMNSFRAVESALKFEEGRLRDNFAELKKEKGKQTRSWNDKKGETRAMRRKEEASDYRYFPEPDVPPITIGGKLQITNYKLQINLKEIKKEIPELPEERRKRYLDLGLEAKAAETIVTKKSYSDYFDEAVRAGGEAHKIYDLMINEKAGITIPLKNLIAAIKLVGQGAISQKMLKEILPELKKGKNPDEIIKRRGLKQMSDKRKLQLIISKIIKNNPQAVESYKEGKREALGFLVGQVMRETRGQANPTLTNKILTKMLK